MAKLIVSDYTTLDGVMEAPQDWLGPFWAPEVDDLSLDLVNSVDALLLGRVTYQDFAAAWPARDGPLADRINGMPKYVASATLGDPGWANVEVLADAIPEVRRLKEAGQDLLIYGSGRLARDLMAMGLVDEFRLWIAPIVVGKGARVFEQGTHQTILRLTDSRRFETGLVASTYVVEK